MNISLAADAVEFGRVAQRALEQGDPEQVLADLGAWELKVAERADELEAAAALCRAVGRAGVPVDAAGRLAGPSEVLGLVLPMWTLLGLMDRAIALTVEHVQVREQFGRPLAKLQNVQFQLTDAEVSRAGVDVLARYALWSRTVEDALALRLGALEAAEVVFRVCHQLHGASGFCDETPLSAISLASLPLRRHPLGLSATRALLADRVGRAGLTGGRQ